jgi:acyl transferase domain-containing protein/acyl carrier protein
VQTRENLREWLVAQVAEKLGIAPAAVDVTQPVADMGLSSPKSVEISAAINERFALEVSPAVLYDHPTIAELVTYLERLRTHVDERAAVREMQHDEPIAIVGIGCRFPGCDAGPGSFLEMLKEGRDAITEVSSARWNAAEVYNPDPEAPGTSCTKWGGFLDGIDLFDPEAFGIPSSEASLMDPQQRLVLQASAHAIEDAGYSLSQLAQTRTGVFVGISRNEYAATRGLPPDNPLTPTGSALSIAANRISYVFDLLGPSLSVDTACSSSLMAVHLACRSLRAGETDYALAGGVSLVLSPDLSIAFTKAGLMAPDGRCKPFSSAADGYVRGEGVGIVTLQRLSDAVAQRRRIYALILGTAVAQDGKSNGLMSPKGASQEQVILDACREARVLPAALDYIETHGTGTKLGDVIEAGAIGNVMKSRARQQGRCVLGSVKSNIGHLEAAAGIASLIKTALCLHERVIVPTLHCSRPNEAIDFDRLGLTVATETREWPCSGGPRVAGVSSFGFGGTNVHAVLGETGGALIDVHAEQLPVPSLLALSAHRPESLRELAHSYARCMEQGANVDEQLRGSFARTERRYRVAVVGDTRERIVTGLRAFAAGAEHPAVYSGESGKQGKVAFVFTGQGGRWSKGAAALFEANSTYQEALLRCDDALRPFLRESILPMLLGEQSAELLKKTENAQPALFAMQVALLEVLRAWHIVPDACIGHSVGEVAAAYGAGALTLQEAAKLVALRGQAMAEDAFRGCMAVVHADSARVQDLIDAQRISATIAAINSKQSTVIAGAHDAVDDLIRQADAQGLAARRLSIDYAFHSEQMTTAAQTLRQALAGTQFGASRVPFFSAVEGGLYEGVADIDYWCANILRPVRFSAAVAAALDFGVTAFIEIGPSDVLNKDIAREAAERGGRACVVSLLRRESPSVTTLPEAIATLFAKGQVSLNPLASRACDAVPTYPWTNGRYWIEATGNERPGVSPRRFGIEAPVLVASEPGKRLWNGTIDTQASRYLLDHQVLGEPVLPGVAHLAVLLEAMREELTQWSLRDLRMERPLPLAEGEVIRVQVIEETRSDGDKTLELFYSRSGSESSKWDRIASATCGRASNASMGAPHLDAVRARCFDQYPGAMFYELLARRGLTYGPAFRLLDQVVGRKGEALGRLAVHAARSASDLGQTAVLDACLHVIAAALGARELSGSQPAFLLPRSIDRVSVMRPGVPRWSYCRVTDASDDHVTADVQLLEDDGGVMAELSGVRLSGSKRAMAQEQRRRRLRDSLYRVDWVEKFGSGSADVRGGRCLVLCDSGGLGEALSGALERVGLSCVRVKRSNAFAACGNDRYTASDAADLRHIIRQYGDDPWRFLFYCWGLDSSGVQSNAKEIAAHPQSLTALVQAAATESMRGKITMAIVTRGAAGITARQNSDPLQSMLWGLARTVTFEHPDLDCRCVDVDPDVPPEQAVETVLLEVSRADRDNCVAYRGGKRFVRRLHRHNLTTEPTRLEGNATYIVTGGLGALGLEVARALGSMGAGRIILVSRGAPTTQQRQQLSELRRDHSDIIHALLDVTDFDAVADLVRRENAIAPVRGIVHAAGVLSDAALVNTSDEQLESVIRPKVLGALALHRAVDDLKLHFFVLFSSVVSVFGSPGQAGYCAANAFLDSLAEQRTARGKRTVSISWSAWADKGMAAKTAATGTLAASRLVDMIPVEDGMELFRSLLESEQPHVLVLPFNVKSLLQFYPSNAGLALFDEIAAGAITSIRSDGAAETIRQRPPLDVEYVAPHTEVQRAIVGIWQSALGMSGIGIRDELFSLGADSVFATQIAGQISQRFGVKLGLGDAFTTFTVEHLAGRVEDELLRRVQRMDDAEVARTIAAAMPLAE